MRDQKAVNRPLNARVFLILVFRYSPQEMTSWDRYIHLNTNYSVSALMGNFSAAGSASIKVVASRLT